MMDNPGSSVLYRGATGLEKAMADVDAARLIDIYAEFITDQWNPYAVSAANLPFLAFAMGVTLWEDEWTEGQKRDWLARQWTFKSLRGTPQAFRMALGMSGYDVTDMVRPPQGYFAAPDLTKEQWDAWIRLMPELRIRFEHKEGHPGADEFFVDAADPLSGELAGTGYADQDAVSLDDGWVLRGRVAVLRHLGVDTPIDVIEYRPDTELLPAVDFERVAIPGQSTIGLFADDDAFDDERYVCFEEKTPELVTLELDRQYSHDRSILGLTTVTPGLDPLTPRYERDSDVGDGGPFEFAGDYSDTMFADREDGGDKLLADRIYLLDPAVSEPMTEGDSFADVTRVGLPSYTAEMLIDLHTQEPNEAVFVDQTAAEESFTVPEDQSDTDRAIRAVLAAKAMRDTILVRFDPTRPIEMGDQLPADAKYGDWIAQLL